MANPLRNLLAYVNLMDMSHPSRTFQLIEARLGSPLVEHVRSMRSEGASWQTIAFDLAARTTVTVTPETIRIWMAPEADMERAKTGAA